MSQPERSRRFSADNGCRAADDRLEQRRWSLIGLGVTAVSIALLAPLLLSNDSSEDPAVNAGLATSYNEQTAAPISDESIAAPIAGNGSKPCSRDQVKSKASSDRARYKRGEKALLKLELQNEAGVACFAPQHYTLTILDSANAEVFKLVTNADCPASAPECGRIGAGKGHSHFEEWPLARIVDMRMEPAPPGKYRALFAARVDSAPDTPVYTTETSLQVE